MEKIKGYVLTVQTLWPVILLKKCKVNYKVQYLNGEISYVKPERFTEESEEICVVWMMNRGIEGSYRIERDLYPHRRKPAKLYPHQLLVWEDSYGVENEFNDYRFKNK